MFYKLTTVQQELLNIEKIMPGTTVNNLFGVMQWQADDDYDVINTCLNQLAKNNDSLRIKLTETEAGVMQYISEYSFYESDYRVFESYDEYAMWLDKEKSKPFQLYNSILFRATVVKVLNEMKLVIVMHHIINDGWGLVWGIGEICKYKDGNEIEQGNSYIDYIESEQQYLTSQKFEKDRAYWGQVLQDYDGTSLFAGYEMRKGLAYNSKRFEYQINAETSAAIRKYCTDTNISEYNFFITLACLYKSKLTHKYNIAVGTPLLNRLGRKERNTLGMYVKVCPFIVALDEEKTFAENQKVISSSLKSMMVHQKLPFDEIRRLQHSFSLQNENLIEFVLDYQNISINEECTAQGYSAKTLNNAHQRLPLIIHVNSRYNDNLFYFEYDYLSEIISDTMLELIHSRILHLVEQIVTGDQALKEISIFSKFDSSLVESYNNRSSTLLPQYKSVYELFLRNLVRNPEKIAISDGNRKLTYRAASLYVNKTAALISGYTGDVVAVISDRNIEYFITFLAIIKLGRTVLPIDPQNPSDRIEYMLADSHADIICDLTGQTTPRTIPVIAINEFDIANIDEGKPFDDLKLSSSFTQAPNAYIIYTSGSTGNPKGVVVGHEGLLNLMDHFDKDLGLTFEENVLQFANISFDASVWEISMSLLYGATLFVLPEDYKSDIEGFYNFANQRGISILTVPPQFLAQLEPAQLPLLKTVITAGSETNNALVQKWCRQRKYVNAYGPTEATICSTFWIAPQDYRPEYEGAKVPIGKAIINTNILVADFDSHIPTPLFAEGELCVTGRHLSKEYIGQPGLTCERYPIINGARYYRTGDIVQYNENGELVFIGRRDSQIKIHGFRIEIGEIESNIRNAFSTIRDIVVLKNQTEKLVAYYVADEDVAPECFISRLSNRLPHYMIPFFWVRIEDIPLNRNGKTDLKQLFALPLTNTEKKTSAQPVTPLEKKLVEIWSSVLEVDDIGITDEFYELGGDSIKAIEILTKIRALGFQCSIQDLLHSGTIKSISNNLEKPKDYPIEEFDETAGFNLLPIQSWFMKGASKNKNYFNQSILIELNDRIDHSILKQAVTAVLSHHASLRTYLSSGEDVHMRYDTTLSADDVVYFKALNEYEMRHVNDYFMDIQTHFQIHKAPLIKILILESDTLNYMFFCSHHLIIDGVSWRILFDDLFAAYSSILNNMSYVLLPHKTTELSLWSAFLQRIAKEAVIQKDREYWLNVSSLYSKNKLSRQKKNQFTKKTMSTCAVSFSEHDVHKIRQNVVGKRSVRMDEFLLVILSYSFRDTFEADSLKLRVETMGRNFSIPYSPDISRTIGWFTAFYPMLIEFGAANNTTDMIRHIKNIYRDVPNNGISYMVLSNYDDTFIVNDASEDMLFNYLGEIADASVPFGKLIEIPPENNLDAETVYENPIQVDALLLHNKLNINIQYDHSMISKEDMDCFTARLQYHASRMILESENTGAVYVGSDFGMSDINDEDLNEIISRIGMNKHEY